MMQNSQDTTTALLAVNDRQANTQNSARAVSHIKNRQFKPEKLSEPRDFVLPACIQQAYVMNKKGSVRQPFVVEIGAGKGKHACLYAEQHPDHHIIAIERTLNKFTAFNKLANDANLGNLSPIHADAIPYCVYAIPPHCIDTLFLLYPNPEQKNPNQQWLNMPFFEFLLSRLKPEGKIILASNIQPYIETAYEQAVNVWKLPIVQKYVPQDSARTHFEIKYLARGEKCWQLEMTRPIDYVTHFDDWVSPYLKMKAETMKVKK